MRRRVIIDLFIDNNNYTEKLRLDNDNGNDFMFKFNFTDQINIDLLKQGTFILYNPSQEIIDKILTIQPFTRKNERVKIDVYLGYDDDYKLYYTGEVYNTFLKQNGVDHQIIINCLSNFYSSKKIVPFTIKKDMPFKEYIDFICNKFNINYVYNSTTTKIISAGYSISGDMKTIFEDIKRLNPDVDVFYLTGKLYITDDNNKNIKDGYILNPNTILENPYRDIFYIYIKNMIISDIKVGDWIKFENKKIIDYNVYENEKGRYNYLEGEFKIYNIDYIGETNGDNFFMHIKALGQYEGGR